MPVDAGAGPATSLPALTAGAAPPGRSRVGLRRWGRPSVWPPWPRQESSSRGAGRLRRPIPTFWPSPRSTCSTRHWKSGTRGWWTSSPGTSTAPDRSHQSRSRWGSSAGRAGPIGCRPRSFGRRIGAGVVVFGSVRKTRDTVSLRATVLDLARNRMASDLEVKGDAADIGDLADSLGVRILQVLGRDRPIGAVRQVSIGSRSLPALKAFLQGEQFYRRGLWDSALVYYDQATAQDSTFGLAYRRCEVGARLASLERENCGPRGGVPPEVGEAESRTSSQGQYADRRRLLWPRG